METVREALPNTETGRSTDYFSDANFAKLKEIMYEYKVSAGSHLFWEGDPADKLYYIVSGRGKIIKSNTEGKEFVMYRFQERDFLGQLDPFHDSIQGMSAIAIRDCVIGVIQKSDLEIVLWQHGDLAIEFMKWMGLMHRLTQTKFRDLLLYGKTGALCSTLIRLSNSYGRPFEEGGTLIAEKLSNSELADYIGSTRENVNRTLGAFKKSGIIDYYHGHIVIKDPDYLKNICKCEHCPKEVCRI